MTVQRLSLGRLKIEPETLQNLDLLAQWRAVSRIQVIQQLLRESARQARLDHVARLYSRGEITLERAAEMAGETIYDLMAYARSHGIVPPGDLAELRTDVAGMLLRAGHDKLAQQVLSSEPPPGE
jgi:predicted HTH domain antitoxin